MYTLDYITSFATAILRNLSSICRRPKACNEKQQSKVIVEQKCPDHISHGRVYINNPHKKQLRNKKRIISSITKQGNKAKMLSTLLGKSQFSWQESLRTKESGRRKRSETVYFAVSDFKKHLLQDWIMNGLLLLLLWKLNIEWRRTLLPSKVQAFCAWSSLTLLIENAQHSICIAPSTIWRQMLVWFWGWLIYRTTKKYFRQWR